MFPVDNTLVSYSELEHSGTTTGSKGGKKPAVDTAYEPLITIKQVLSPRKQHKALLLGHRQTPNHPGASLDKTQEHLSSAHGPLLFTLPTGM